MGQAEEEHLASAADAGRSSPASLLAVDRQDLRKLLMTLWRQRKIIASTMGLIVGLTVLTVFQVTPKYTATSQVMLETRQSQVVDIESVVSGMSADMATLMSEVEVIRSSSLIGRVIQKLNLLENPDFNPDILATPWYVAMFDLETYLPRDILVSIGLRAVDDETADEKAQRLLSRAVAILQEELVVRPVRRSFVINISYTYKNPRLASRIANSMADFYIVEQLEAKFEATRRATSWLNDRLAALRTKVKESESAVELYQSQITSEMGQRFELTEQQISELNTELILTRGKRAEASARLEQVETLTQPGREINSASEVLNSPLIQRLRDQEAKLQRKISELGSRYGPRHPNMIKAQAERVDLNASIEREIQKIAQSLRNEVQIVVAREKALIENLRELDAKSSDQGRARIRLRELERDAEANSLLYENFLSRFKETGAQQDLQEADARIISRAEVPRIPSYPRKGMILLVALIGSSFLGVALVFVLERLDNSFRSSEQLEQATGLPVLGMVPLLEDAGSAFNVAEYVAKNPGSTLTEAVRSLKTSLLLSNVDDPVQVLGITSTVPGEGKSTLAVWLAQISAQSDQKILIIDCDLRRPNIHRTLKLKNDLSLVEVLTGECSADDAIIRDPSDSYSILPAKLEATSALELLSSQHMADTVAQLRTQFDFIILDSPPILAVSDARVIGQLTDSIFYAVKWDAAAREIVQSGVRAAHDANINISGAVFTQVNIARHARYGYGDYGTYYGRYKEYYTN